MTYQLKGSNRFEGYLSKQRYDKPNRGAATRTRRTRTQGARHFVITRRSLWNSVLSDRGCSRHQAELQQHALPAVPEDRPAADHGQSHEHPLLATGPTQPMMFRRRLQIMSNWQYYVPQLLGGRHEFKVGFDNGYTPEDVDTNRVDDVSTCTCTVRCGHRRDGAVAGDDLQLAAAPQTRGHEHGALRPGLVLDRPVDRDRRHPMGADRGLSARADDAAKPRTSRKGCVFKGRTSHQRAAT